MIIIYLYSYRAFTNTWTHINRGVRRVKLSSHVSLNYSVFIDRRDIDSTSSCVHHDKLRQIMNELLVEDGGPLTLSAGPASPAPWLARTWSCRRW